MENMNYRRDAAFDNGKYSSHRTGQKHSDAKNMQIISTRRSFLVGNPHHHGKDNRGNEEEISIVLSIVYGLVIVILAIIFKITESVTQKSYRISIEYQIVLFAVAIVWLIVFKLYHTWLQRKTDIREEIRSPHASNRWLKGVVALFGFAIIIKDSLDVIGTAEIDNPKCDKHAVFFSNFILHALFIMGQVVLLFFYAKVHIQEMKCISRFGVMHLMASNLAVWVSVIADETSHALNKQPSTFRNSESDNLLGYGQYSAGNYTKLEEDIKTHCNSSSMLLNYFSKSDYNDSADGLFSGSCSCRTPICSVIGRAEKFLSPLLVEYCLVSSCLLYVLWSHIGRDSHHHGPVAKPSHKFYKSYKGVVLGAVMLVATVIVMTLLGTLYSGSDSKQKSYYSESHSLLIYESFLLAFNIAVFIACCLGFYIYSIAKLKRNNSGATLDIVLLFICVAGPLLVGIFSALGLIAGDEDTKASGWVVSLMSALADVVVSIVQVLFAVHGLNKEAGTLSETLTDKEEKKEQSMTSYIFQNSNPCPTQSTNQNEKIETIPIEMPAFSGGVSNPAAETEENSTMPNPPAILLNQHQENASVSKSTWSSYDLDNKSLNLSQPAPVRIILRDIMVFLVMCNTCLYVFLSLSHGTVFSVYFYASDYFGHSAWTTLASVTAPFSIFLKLHFAACFFEIWSYS